MRPNYGIDAALITALQELSLIKPKRELEQLAFSMRLLHRAGVHIQIDTLLHHANLTYTPAGSKPSYLTVSLQELGSNRYNSVESILRQLRGSE